MEALVLLQNLQSAISFSDFEPQTIIFKFNQIYRIILKYYPVCKNVASHNLGHAFMLPSFPLSIKCDFHHEQCFTWHCTPPWIYSSAGGGMIWVPSNEMITHRGHSWRHSLKKYSPITSHHYLWFYIICSYLWE